MRQISILTALAISLAATVTGCGSGNQTAASGDLGSVSLNVIVGDVDVTSVAFDLTCDDGFSASGMLNVNDEQDPPVWALVMAVPQGDCSVTLTAFDDQGAPLCSGSDDFTVVAGQTVKATVVLTCGIDVQELLGNVEIDATFVIIQGSCPRLHFLNAVPDEVPPEGSEVTVLASDADDDPFTTALTATSGSFADPAAQSTTYTCDGAGGVQTISVTLSDGNEACDSTKSYDVSCPGDNPCDGVTCPDDGNECTTATCNPANGECETADLDGNECGLDGGGTVELAVNGGFETGNLDGWTTFCAENNGTCAATMAQANAGLWSGNLVASVPGGGGPASFPLIKNANIGIGTVAPNSSVTISFDLFGSLAGGGGVVFAEFFSELSGGGTSKSEILSGGPLFPNAPNDWTADWVSYSFTTTTGNDVSGGVTLQLKVDCGANPGCTVDTYWDNVSVTVESDGGIPGICSGGECVPPAECTVGGDCPDDGNECTDAVCNVGTCGVVNNTNVCDGGNGTCSGGQCVPDAECVVGGDCPDDGNECTDAVCNAGICGASNNTNVCDGGNGSCNAGVCVPNEVCEVEQDFESLDINSPTALSGDGWLFFANVFDQNGTFLFPFGPGGAPNATVSPSTTFISAVVAGEGDLPQGDQQLSVFSDYNCCQPNSGHFNGTDRVEINVFQEVNPIPAAFIGQTVEFTFDAKRGNIEGATTALAFILTLDPSTGFSLTNFVPVDLTSVPASWGSFSISLALTDPALEGQILQFGFRNTASNFEGSGIFYDNVQACLQ